MSLFTRNGGGPTNPNPRLSAEMLQADLAQIGIKLDIRVMEWAEMLRRAKAGEADWCLPAGPATTVTRTTSSARCSAARLQRTVRTTPAGATRRSRSDHPRTHDHQG